MVPEREIDTLLLDSYGQGLVPYHTIATEQDLGTMKIDSNSLLVAQDGTLTVKSNISGSAGNSSTPIYYDNQEFKECDKSKIMHKESVESIGNSITPVYANADGTFSTCAMLTSPDLSNATKAAKRKVDGPFVPYYYGFLVNQTISSGQAYELNFKPILGNTSDYWYAVALCARAYCNAEKVGYTALQFSTTGLSYGGDYSNIYPTFYYLSCGAEHLRNSNCSFWLYVKPQYKYRIYGTLRTIKQVHVAMLGYYRIGTMVE